MEQLGPYVVVSELGRGGAGVVLRCRAPDGGEVAVKVLLDPRKNTLLARFARERQLLDELAEEGGFVPLLDAGESPRGPYLVMPFVGGGTLRARLSREHLSRGQALELVTTLAEAVGRAHARGIVHRDLKPENVLFTVHRAPLIADLGLAKHFAGSSPGAAGASLSRTGELRGTVGYMAPEQIRSAKDVGPPADVFALGAILFECLTRRPAFVGEGVTEVMTRVLEGSHDSVRSLSPDTPRWLSDLVDRALAADEADRLQDGAELAAAIERGLRGETGGLRRRVRLGALGALGVALALGVGVLLRGGEPERAPAPPTPEPTATTPERATGTTTVAAVPSLVVTGRLGSTWLRHARTATAVAIGPGAAPGSEVAFVGDTDGLVHVSRLPDGEEVTSFTAFPGDKEPIRALLPVAGPVHGVLVLGRRRGLAFARPAAGTLKNLSGHRTRVVAAATAWKTPLSASVDESGVVFVIELAKGKEVMNIDCSSHPPTALAFLPGDTTLLVAMGTGEVVPVLLEPSKVLPRLFAAKPPLRALAVSPEGDWIAVSRRDGPPVVVNVAKSSTGGLDGVGSASVLAFGPGGKLFGVVDDGQVFQTDMATRTAERLARSGSHATPGLVALADGRALFLSEPVGQPRLLGEPADEGHESVVLALLPLPGGRLASGGADRTVRLWDLATGHELACAREHADVVVSLAPEPDGGFLSASRDGAVISHDGATARRRAERAVPGRIGRVRVTSDARAWASTDAGVVPVDGEPGPAGSSGDTVELAAVDDHLLAWEREGTLTLIDPRSGQVRWQRLLVTPTVHRAIAPVSSTRAAVAHEEAVLLLDLATGEDVWPAPVAIGSLGALAASPDGRFLALLQRDAVVLLSATTGEVLSRAAVAGKGDAATSVAFAGDELLVGLARGPIMRLLVTPRP